MVEINKGVALGNDSLNKLMQKYLAKAEMHFEFASGSLYDYHMDQGKAYAALALTVARAMR